MSPAERHVKIIAIQALKNKVTSLQNYRPHQQFWAQFVARLTEILDSQSPSYEETLEKITISELQTEYENLLINAVSLELLNFGQEQTLLMHAAKNGDDWLIVDLLRVYPNIGIDQSISNILDEDDGCTALLLAVQYGHPKAAKLLIQAFAKLTIDNDLDALKMVSQEQDPEMYTLIQNAKFIQIDLLCHALINAAGESEHEVINEKVKDLGIKKSDLVEYLFEMYPDDPARTLEVLHKSLEVDDGKRPNNPLAEYIQTHYGVFYNGKDTTSISRIQERIDELEVELKEMRPKLIVAAYKPVGPQALMFETNEKYEETCYNPNHHRFF